jgi:NTE family protein
MSESPSRVPIERPSQLIDLALQGGGSHGAFTWGVLDRFLEESWFSIEAISGTSAGAMNAAVMADGHAGGGNEAAREALEAFWRRVSQAAAFTPLQRSPLDVLLGRWSLDHSPAYIAFDMMARVFSPYDLAFGATNPLTKVLSESIDFARLAAAPIKLFITATNVRTGRPRVFRNAELSPDVLLASACLPTMFQAVGDRRRGLLGRRLFRQSDHDPAGAGMRIGRHDPDRHQSGGAPGHSARGA